MAVLETKRLILRRWKATDLVPFAATGACSKVMKFFPAVLSPAESEQLVQRIEAHFEQNGFGLYATELKVNGKFIGFIGLARPTFPAHFTPCVEIGWRLSADYWNQGLATEGAQRVLEYGFLELKLPEIVSMTATINLPSRRVMEKLKMHRDPSEDFDHPKIAAGTALARHVLYRASGV